MSIVKLSMEHHALMEACLLNVSNEAVGSMGFVSGLLNKLKSFFTSSKKQMDETAQSLYQFDVKNPYRHKPIELPQFTAMAKRDYLSIQNIELYCSEKFSGNFSEYAKFLLDAQSALNRLDVDLITPFTAYIGEAVMKPHLLHAMSFKPPYNIQDTAPMIAQMRKFFTKRTGSLCTWGEAFSRNAEVDILKQQMGDIDANYKAMNPQQIKQSVDGLNEHLEGLFKLLEEGEMGTVIDSKHVKYVADSILAVAKQVEFYSVIYYATMAFKKVLADNEVKLKKQK